MLSYGPMGRPLPLTTVDVCAFRLEHDRLQVLLVQREHEPFLRNWALPGSVVHADTDATLQDCARRAVLAKTGIRIAYMEQVSTVGDGHRDPRGWSISVVYMALLQPSARGPRPLAHHAHWVDLGVAPQTLQAFDHQRLLLLAIERLRNKSRYSSLPIHLLAQDFTLAELQTAFELCTECRLERKAFRRRMLEAGILEDTGEQRSTGARPAAVYRARPDHLLHLFARTVGSRTETILHPEHPRPDDGLPPGGDFSAEGFDEEPF